MVTCQNGQHDWAPTGLWVDGVVHYFCRNKDCKAEARQVWQMIEGPGMSIDGMHLDIEDDPRGTVAKTICREAQGQYNDLDLQPGDVVVDIGAHVGIISIYLAKRYPGIRVYAYEPDETNYSRLTRNIGSNRLGLLTKDTANINWFNYAVTGDGRDVTLRGDLGQNSGGSTIYGPDQIGWNPQVKSTTLANIVKTHNIDRIALLKIDCESAEYEILVKHQELLDHVTHLRGEFHPAPPEWQDWDQRRLLEMCAQHIKPENIKVTFNG